MVIFRRLSSFMSVLGLLLIGISALSAWFVARGVEETLSVTPATNETIKASALLMVAAAVVGVVLVVARQSAAVVGCVGALWLNVSALVWIGGARASLLVPNHVLPENAMLRLGLGASIGLAGALLAVIGATVMLVEDTWPGARTPGISWFPLVSLAVVAACLSTRAFDWFEVDAGPIQWSLDYDVVPFVGDGLSVVLLVSAGLTVVHLFRPQRWAAILLSVLGAAIAAIGLVAFGSASLLESGAQAALERASFLEEFDPRITATNGPLVVLLLGAVVCFYALGSLRLCAGTREGFAERLAGRFRSVTRSSHGTDTTATSGVTLPGDPF